MPDRGTETRNRILDSAEALVLDQGFSATSIDDIISATGVTKGAFFHHFRSKSDLARRLVERFAETDFELFDEFDRRSDALADDPLQSLLIFLKLFEEWLTDLQGPFAGCLFAVYVYESKLFEEELNAYIKKSLQHWQGYYERKFEAILAERKPAFEITAKELSETVLSTLEGAFVLARAYGDRELNVRQSRLLRGYLQLLFGDSG